MPDPEKPEPAQPKIPILLALLFGLTGPSIFGTLAYKSKLSLISAVILAAIWTAIAALCAKLWGRIEKTIVELLGDLLEIHIREWFSKYQKRYLEHLLHRHRSFDVKGLSTQGIYTLELDQVYVELIINPSTISSNSANPIAAPIPEGRHDILTYLLSPQMRQHNFAVIGAPGSGKTTLLKHLTIALAARRGPFRKFRRLPILLFIRDHAPAIVERPALTLAEAATESAEKMGIPAPANWFQRRLERARCLVLLDGLDEVADRDARQKVATWVEAQMKRYGGARFLISSRRFGYLSNPLAGLTSLSVMPFNWQQVERFVTNWYLANEVMSAQRNDEGVQIAAREGAADLLNRLRNTPALTDLAVNPLLLTMITTVHRYRSSLPGRRVELYGEVCDVFLGRRQQARGMELGFTPAQKISVLQPLAFHMMCANKREVPLDEASNAISQSLVLVDPSMSTSDFLEMVEDSSGLLLERENSVYAFAHLTFQEYLAAKHIQEEKLESQLLSYVSASWWHETIRLYAALGDASNIVEACISKSDPSVAALTLAVECLEEARSIQPHLREKTNALVEEGIEHPNLERRRLAAETLLSLRLRHMARVNDDHYVDNTLITNAEYQLFIDERRADKQFHQPDHWQNFEYESGTGKEPIAGVRPSDAVAFCKWLSSREPGDWEYLPPAQDLGKCGSGRVGYWALGNQRASLVGASTRIDLKETPTPVIERLGRDFARDLDANLERYPELSLVLDRDDEIEPAPELDRILHLVNGDILALELELELELLARDRDLADCDFESTIEACKASGFIADFLRDLLRSRARAAPRLALFNVLLPNSYHWGKSPSWLGRFRHKSISMTERNAANRRTLAALAILEDRIQGKLSAFEGIRITKVRRTTQPTPAHKAATA